jgi:hypothetical protein
MQAENTKLRGELATANQRIGELTAEVRIAKQLQNQCKDCECDESNEHCSECWNRDKWKAKTNA